VFVIKIDGPDDVIQCNLERKRNGEKDDAVSQDDDKRSRSQITWRKISRKTVFFYSSTLST
jgi:hypothetical protein